MKITITSILCLLFINVLSQEFVGEFNKVRPDSAFNNVHVIKISSNEQSTTFAIWVKLKVKMHKHVDHVENIYVTQGEGKFHGVAPQSSSGGSNLPSYSDVFGRWLTNTQSPEFKGLDRVFKN